jgi:hypothetical protein
LRFGFAGSVLVHAAMVGAILLASAVRPEVLPTPIDSISVDIVGLQRDIRPDPNAAAPPPPEDTPSPAPEDAAETVPSDQPNPAAKPSPPARRPDPLKGVRGLIDPTRDEANRAKTPSPSGAGSQLIASEADSILRRLESCWREWSDIPNPDSIVVVVQATFNPDGTLRGAPQVVRAKSVLPPGGYSAVAIQRSVNALVECQPYRLAPNRQRPVTQLFRFSPRGYTTAQ